jgi:hypothetical protein
MEDDILEQIKSDYRNGDLGLENNQEEWIKLFQKLCEDQHSLVLEEIKKANKIIKKHKKKYGL